MSIALSVSNVPIVDLLNHIDGYTHFLQLIFAGVCTCLSLSIFQPAFEKARTSAKK